MIWHANVRALKEALYFVVWVMSLEPNPLKFPDLEFSILLMASVYVSRESLQQEMQFWNFKWAGKFYVIEVATVLFDIFKAAITLSLKFSWCLRYIAFQTPVKGRFTGIHRMQLLKSCLSRLVKNQQKRSFFHWLYWTTRDKIKLCAFFTCPHVQNLGPLPSSSLGLDPGLILKHSVLSSCHYAFVNLRTSV